MKKLAVAVLVLFLAAPVLAAEKGEEVYKQACAMCHDKGIAGAPVTGDQAVWKDRLGKGMETLVANSINGFRGDKGFMPPRGGRASLSDEQVADAVEFMVKKSQ